MLRYRSATRCTRLRSRPGHVSKLPLLPQGEAGHEHSDFLDDIQSTLSAAFTIAANVPGRAPCGVGQFAFVYLEERSSCAYPSREELFLSLSNSVNTLCVNWEASAN